MTGIKYEPVLFRNEGGQIVIKMHTALWMGTTPSVIYRFTTSERIFVIPSIEFNSKFSPIADTDVT